MRPGNALNMRTLLLRSLLLPPATTAAPAPGAAALAELGRTLEARARKLFGRSLAIREVDAGSCNGCELEIIGLFGPVYDMERFGLHFVASPRHADMLLVTGPVTRNMAVPLRMTYDATPDPKLVVAVGDCAHTCGVFAGSYAVVGTGAVADVIPVDLHIPGCPPRPAALLEGLIALVDKAAGVPRAQRST